MTLKNNMKYLAALTAVVLVSACSSTSTTNQWANSTESVTYLTPQSSNSIQFAQQGEMLDIIDINKRRYQVKVKERYFAASGRWCVKAQATDQSWVFCDYSQQAEDRSHDIIWGVSRNYRNTANEVTAQ